MDEQAFKKILADIEQNKFITLDLSNKNLTVDQLSALANKLKHNKLITHLNLSGTPINFISAGHLAERIILADSSLVALDLSNCQIQKTSATILLDAQKSNSKLVIDLTGNPGIAILEKEQKEFKPAIETTLTDAKSNTPVKPKEKAKKDAEDNKPDSPSNIKSLTLGVAQLALGKITADEMIILIEKLIAQYNPTKPNNNLKENLTKIYGYFYNPTIVQGATKHGGMQKIIEKYNPLLLRIALHVFPKKPILLTTDEATTAAKGMTLLAQRYKLKHAYRALLTGTKFKKAELGTRDTKKPLQQDNPVIIKSRENIHNLIQELKEESNPKALYGLRKDEHELFKLLLDLPFKLQHATNHWYPILNSGGLNSYAEIKRTQPEFVSQYSTKGNITKLGNAGFVFFRTYVDSVNNSQTRYGDTTLTFDFDLLRSCGWVSLHDQLVPLSTSSTKRFYWDNRILRTAAVVGLKNKTQDKTLHDGFVYRYRTSPIASYKGKKDTQSSFGKAINVKERESSFLEEIFYGKDILLGIALSVIRELRYLEECGFRQYFLKLLKASTPAMKTKRLGELIKSFFRIEGKYPATLRLATDAKTESHTFSPFARTETRKETDQRFVVTNPDGDGRYNSDLSVNEKATQLATLRERKKQLEEKLSIARRQKARFKDTPSKQESLDKRIADINTELTASNKVLDEDGKKHHLLTEHFITACDSSAKELEKVDTSKLEIIKDCFSEILEDDKEPFNILINMPTEKLRLLGKEVLVDLILEGWVTFNELAQCSTEELGILSSYDDIKKPIIENEMSIGELLALHAKDPMHLTCLTCDDLTDLVYEMAPDVDPVLLDYAQQADVDFDWVIEQLSEYQAVLFKTNLSNNEYSIDDEEQEELSQDEQQDREEFEFPEEDSLFKELFPDMTEEKSSPITRKNHTKKNNTLTALPDYPSIKAIYVQRFIPVTSPAVSPAFFKSTSNTEINSIISELKENQTAELDLSDKTLSAHEFIKVMTILASNRSVTKLNLENFEVSLNNTKGGRLPKYFFKCVLALTDAINKNTNLTDVNLLGCSLVSIHTQSICFIVSAIKTNRNISSLDIDTNYIDGYEIENDVSEINARQNGMFLMYNWIKKSKNF